MLILTFQNPDVSCQLANMKCSIFLLEMYAKNKHSPCSVLMPLFDKLFQLKINMPQAQVDSLSKRALHSLVLDPLG